MSVERYQYAQQLSFWAHLTQEEQILISEQSMIRCFEKGQLINSSDTSCMGMVLVIEGTIRVSLISDEGREITLFRITGGDTCVTTASCVIRQITFDTVVTADENTRLFILPAPLFGRLAETNIYVRAFMFEKETERFSQVIGIMQRMLFKRFDVRLAEYLLESYHLCNSADLRLTQEEIARDINSAREVVTRMLRKFAADGLVEVKRGHIILCDPERLQEIVSGK